MSKYYAVRKGRIPGIYTSWAETQTQVNGFSGAEFKSFPTQEQAQQFIAGTTGASQNYTRTGKISSAKSNTRTGTRTGTNYTRPSKPFNSTSSTNPSLPSNSIPTNYTGPNQKSYVKSSNKYYVIITGHQPGMYTNWPQAQKQIKGYPEAIYKSFTSLEEAQTYQDFWMDNNKYLDQPADYYFYTDGSYKNQQTGYAYVLVDNNDNIIDKEFGPVKHSTNTNNVGELQALLQALRYINTHNTNFINKIVKIKTDSVYAMQQTITLAADLKIKGWDNWVKYHISNDTKNFDYMQNIVYQYVLAIQNNVLLSIEHVYGHTGQQFNELADQLANSGREMN